MSIELSVTAHVTGADVEDARKQLFNLFGVALFQGPVTEPTRSVTTYQHVEGDIELAAKPAASAEPYAGHPEVAPLAPAKRNRRTKAQIEADRQALEAMALEAEELAAAHADTLGYDIGDQEPSPDDEFDLLGDGGSTPAPRTLTQADMMAAGRAVMDAKGLPGLGAILQRHGFKKVAEIPEHAYAAVMADLEEAVS